MKRMQAGHGTPVVGSGVDEMLWELLVSLVLLLSCGWAGWRCDAPYYMRRPLRPLTTAVLQATASRPAADRRQSGWAIQCQHGPGSPRGGPL